MEDMEKTTVHRLIEWLKAHGHDDEDIVNCIDYITGSAQKPTVKEKPAE